MKRVALAAMIPIRRGIIAKGDHIMNFQIQPLQGDDFEHLFDLDDTALAARQARRMVVAAHPGTPCRVSMQDARVGETVILFNYEHQPEDSPYQARHAVFIRQHAQQASFDVNEVPDVICSRLISLRYFDRDHMMIDADVVAGDAVAQALSAAFDNHTIAYAHIHNAKPGCFAAAAYRVA